MRQYYLNFKIQYENFIFLGILLENSAKTNKSPLKITSSNHPAVRCPTRKSEPAWNTTWMTAPGKTRPPPQLPPDALKIDSFVHFFKF